MYLDFESVTHFVKVGDQWWPVCSSKC